MAFGAKSKHIAVTRELPAALEKLQQHAIEAEALVHRLLLDMASGAETDLAEQFTGQLGNAVSELGVSADADSMFHAEADDVCLSLLRFELPANDDLRFRVSKLAWQKLQSTWTSRRLSVLKRHSPSPSGIQLIVNTSSMGSTSATKDEEEIDLSVLITFEGDLNAKEVSVTAVEITEGPKSIDFGHVEFEHGDDRDEEYADQGKFDDPLPDEF